MTSQIPAEFQLTRTTPTFDNENVPAGLLNAHRVADDVWGRLVVYTGQVAFFFEDQPDVPEIVRGGGHVDIAPARPHHLELDQPATFAVEFELNTGVAIGSIDLNEEIRMIEFDLGSGLAHEGPVCQGHATEDGKRWGEQVSV